MPELGELLWLGLLVGFVQAPVLIGLRVAVLVVKESRWILVGFQVIVALLLIGINQWARPLLRGLVDWVPLIGDAIASGFDQVIDFITGLLQVLVADTDVALGEWLNGLAESFEIAAQAVESGALWLGAAVEKLTFDYLPRFVETAVAPLRESLFAQGEKVDELDRSTTDRIEALRTLLSPEQMAQVEAVITDYVAARGWEPLTPDELDATILVVIERVLPGIDLELGRIEAELDVQAVKLDETADALGKIMPWVLTVGGAVGAATAVESFGSVIRNRDKLARFCQLDESEWDDLLGLLVPVLTLAAILEIARAGVTVTGWTGEAISGILRS